MIPRRTLIIALPCAQVEFTDPRWIPLTRRITHPVVRKDSRSRRVMCVSVSRDPLKIGRPPSWGRVTLTRLVFLREDVLCVLPNVYLIVLPREDDLACTEWTNRLVNCTNLEIRSRFTVLPREDVMRRVSIVDSYRAKSSLVKTPPPPLGVFFLSRNSLGKGFRELGRGGGGGGREPWKVRLHFPKGPCGLSRRPTAIWDRNDCLN